MVSTRSEADIDEALIDSFPASDAPSWTLGDERPRRTGGTTMAVAKAEATWAGTLKEGTGTVKGATRFLDAPFTYRSRFEGDATGTNPEELIGAAHAGCFSMFLAAQLTTAGFAITAVHLDVRAKIPGADQAKLDEVAKKAKEGCPVSKVLNAKITMDAKLT